MKKSIGLHFSGAAEQTSGKASKTTIATLASRALIVSTALLMLSGCGNIGCELNPDSQSCRDYFDPAKSRAYKLSDEGYYDSNYFDRKAPKCVGTKNKYGECVLWK